MADEVRAVAGHHAERHLRRHQRRVERAARVRAVRAAPALRPRRRRPRSAAAARRAAAPPPSLTAVGGRARAGDGAVARRRERRTRRRRSRRSRPARPAGCPGAPARAGRRAPRETRVRTSSGMRRGSCTTAFHLVSGANTARRVQVHEHAAVRIGGGAVLVGGDQQHGEVVVERHAHAGGQVEAAGPHLAERDGDRGRCRRTPRRPSSARLPRGARRRSGRRRLRQRMQQRRQLAAGDAERDGRPARRAARAPAPARRSDACRTSRVTPRP